MTPDLRRRLALMLVGAAAMLVALLVRQRMLHDATASSARATALGVLAGITLAVVLWRTFTYFVTRGRR